MIVVVVRGIGLHVPGRGGQPLMREHAVIDGTGRSIRFFENAQARGPRRPEPLLHIDPDHLLQPRRRARPGKLAAQERQVARHRLQQYRVRGTARHRPAGDPTGAQKAALQALDSRSETRRGQAPRPFQRFPPVAPQAGESPQHAAAKVLAALVPRLRGRVIRLAIVHGGAPSHHPRGRALRRRDASLRRALRTCGDAASAAAPFPRRTPPHPPASSGTARCVRREYPGPTGAPPQRRRTTRSSPALRPPPRNRRRTAPASARPGPALSPAAARTDDRAGAPSSNAPRSRPPPVPAPPPCQASRRCCGCRLPPRALAAAPAGRRAPPAGTSPGTARSRRNLPAPRRSRFQAAGAAHWSGGRSLSNSGESASATPAVDLASLDQPLHWIGGARDARQHIRHPHLPFLFAVNDHGSIRTRRFCSSRAPQRYLNASAWRRKSNSANPSRDGVFNRIAQEHGAGAEARQRGVEAVQIGIEAAMTGKAVERRHNGTVQPQHVQPEHARSQQFPRRLGIERLQCGRRHHALFLPRLPARPMQPEQRGDRFLQLCLRGGFKYGITSVPYPVARSPHVGAEFVGQRSLEFVPSRQAAAIRGR